MVATETLAVANMVRNRHLSRALSDMALGEFYRQMAYKAPLYGSVHAPVGRFYPSSKTCHACGAVRETLALSERLFVCLECGNIEDRDKNAAMNIRDEGIRTAGLAVSQACGEVGAGPATGETGLCEAGTMPCSLVGTL